MALTVTLCSTRELTVWGSKEVIYHVTHPSIFTHLFIRFFFNFCINLDTMHMARLLDTSRDKAVGGGGQVSHDIRRFPLSARFTYPLHSCFVGLGIFSRKPLD